jgi:hypothetical protein
LQKFLFFNHISQSSSWTKVTARNFFFQDLSRIFRPFANCVFVNKLLCFKILIIPTFEQRDKFFFQTKVFEHRSHLSDNYFDFHCIQVIQMRSGKKPIIRHGEQKTRIHLDRPAHQKRKKKRSKRANKQYGNIISVYLWV